MNNKGFTTPYMKFVTNKCYAESSSTMLKNSLIWTNTHVYKLFKHLTLFIHPLWLRYSDIYRNKYKCLYGSIKGKGSFDVSHDVMASFTSYLSSKHWPLTSSVKRKDERFYCDRFRYHSSRTWIIIVCISFASKKLITKPFSELAENSHVLNVKSYKHIITCVNFSSIRVEIL